MQPEVKSWCVALKGKPRPEILALKRSGTPISAQYKACAILLDELDAEEAAAATKRAEDRHQEVVSAAVIAAKKEEVHTLWRWWQLADREERFGMVGFYSGLFFLGYLCAKTNFVSRLIDLAREVMP